MSNVLARKKKRMQPLGYKENIHVINQQRVRIRNYANGLAEKTFLDMKLISYQALHDRFGFGLKRIQRLEQGLNNLLNDKVSTLEWAEYLTREKGIDLSSVDIPQRDLIAFQNLGYNNNNLPLKNKIDVVFGTVSDYIILSVVVLKTQFKFSKKQIEKYVDGICYLINCLATGYETMTGIASVLEWECKYIDKRFIGKTYEI